MNGAAISGGDTPAGIYNAVFDSSNNTATFQTQFYDGSFTKVVFVKLQQSGSDVQALSYAGRAGYNTVYVSDASGTGTTLGNDFTTATYTGSTNSAGQLATSSSSGGYGVKNFEVTSKVIFTGTNTYTGTTTETNTVNVRSSGGAGTASNSYRSQTARGTVQLGSGSTSGSLTSTSFVNAGLLILNRSDSAADLSSVISGSGHLIKTGTGSYILSGTNTYTGSTIVNSGILRASNTAALGATSAGTAVVSGAALEIITSINAEPLTLNGTGISSGGALRNISGNNTYAGAITQASASEISSDSGTLTLDVASGNGITGTFNLIFGGSGNITVADPIATSTGTLTKEGSGTLTLSAANTYTGVTTISAGALRISNSSALGGYASGQGTTVSNGAALELIGLLQSFEPLTLNGTGISSGGALRNISGDNGYVGLITLVSASRINSDSGTLDLNVASGNAITGTFNLTFGGSGNITVSDPIVTSSGTLTKDGSGVLTLSANNTYTGSTNINAGTLLLSGKIYCPTTSCNTELNPAGVVTVSSGTTLEFKDWGWLGSFGSNYYDSTNLVIDGGTLKYSGASNSSSARGFTVTSNGATFENSTSGTTWTLDRSSSVGHPAVFNGSVTFAAAGNISVAQIISGTGALTKTGAGTLTLSNTNTYSGTTTISTGTLSVTGSLGSGTYTANIANSGTLEMGSSSNQTLSGIISGAGALVKSGSGTLILSGANTYSGATTIKAGTVQGNYTTVSSTTSSFGANTSTITIGDTTGSNNASLLVGYTGLTYLQPIVLATGTTGTLTIGNNGTAVSTTFSGGVTGTNNLTINSNATTGTITFSTNPYPLANPKIFPVLLIVIDPVPPTIELDDLKLIKPEYVAADPLFIKAPLELIPVPLSVNASDKTKV